MPPHLRPKRNSVLIPGGTRYGGGIRFAGIREAGLPGRLYGSQQHEGARHQQGPVQRRVDGTGGGRDLRIVKSVSRP